jgi:hypothetical protein
MADRQTYFDEHFGHKLLFTKPNGFCGERARKMIIFFHI